jgi:filamentous hemagglutinin
MRWPGPSLAGVNPGYPATGRTENCVQCAIATDATLAGTPTEAGTGGPQKLAVLEAHFGVQFDRTPMTVAEIEGLISSAGLQARGIIFGRRFRGTGHVFNVMNWEGTVWFVDGQTGQEADLTGFASLYLLRTGSNAGAI